MFLLYSCILICLTLILSWQEKVFLEYLVMDNFQNFMFSFISGCNFPFSMHFFRWPWLWKPPVDFLSFSTSIDIQCTTIRALVKLWNINVTKVLNVNIFKIPALELEFVVSWSTEVLSICSFHIVQYPKGRNIPPGWGWPPTSFDQQSNGGMNLFSAIFSTYDNNRAIHVFTLALI